MGGGIEGSIPLPFPLFLTLYSLHRTPYSRMIKGIRFTV